MRILRFAHSTGGISLVNSTQALLELRGTSHSGVWNSSTEDSEAWVNKTPQDETWTNKTYET